MSPCNHSNFPGALWRTDNSVRGVPFLFFTPPSFPPSHLFSLPLLSWAVCWILHLTGFSLTQPACFCAFYVDSEVWILAQRKAAADNCCHNCLLLSLWVTCMDSQNYLRTLFLCIQKAVLCWHRQKCAPKALSQPVTPLSTFQRLCCQTMVLPLRAIALRICNA